MKKGFTLIEILAVITIIGLVFVFAMPKIVNTLKNKKSEVDTTTTNLIVTAAKSYVNDNQDDFDKIDSNVYCLPISTLTKKNYLESPVKSITDDKDITNIKSVKITYDKGFKYAIVDKNNCNVKKVEYATKYLLKKANCIEITNYTDGNTHEMYTFSHDVTAQTPALTDYRYIGNVPNNYVSFNNGETWRIIGVFDTDDGTGKYEKRLKIVRNNSLGNKKWNSVNKNDWVGCAIQVYLNGEYALDATSMGMIDGVKWFLGGMPNNSSDGSAFYAGERSEMVPSNDRSKNWIGNIGLMYPSDYIYTYSLGVNNMCYNNPANCRSSEGGIPTSGWLYNSSYSYWTMTVDYSNIVFTFHITSQGYLLRTNSADSLGISPTLYLKSNVRIKSGDGTIDNPYQLSL